MPKLKAEKTYTKVSDYYRIKYTDPKGVVHYGIVDSADEAAKRRFNQGVLRVDDAVLPTYMDIPVGAAIPVEFSTDYANDEYNKYLDAELEKAQRVSDRAGNGLRVGKLIAVGVADGSAWYVVTKVNKTTACIEWRGFCPDRWHDQVLGWGGSFPKRRIESLCRGRWLEQTSRART